MIIDMRYLNAFLKLKKFKLDSLPLALRSVSQDCHFTKTDLRSGFSHVKVAKRFRKFLGFAWEGQYYHFRVLPFGLASSPFLFSKMLLPAIQHLRMQGLKLFVYVDDILVISQTAKMCWEHTLKLRNLLSTLGWVVREDKSSQAPNQEILFLGFLVNSRSMTLSLPPGKAHSVVHDLRRFARRPILYPRKVVARVLGLAMSTSPAVPLAKALSRRLMNCVHQPFLPWNARIPVPQEAREDILLLADLISSLRPVPIVPASPSLTIQTDASQSGFGAVLLETGATVKGPWVLIDLPQSISINFLELKAVHLALQHFTIPLGSVVRIQSDNATTVAYLRTYSGRVPVLHDLVRQIMDLSSERELQIQPVHIPGKLNIIADSLSRDHQDWSISQEAFYRICNALQCHPEVDRFASSLNTKLPRFNSRWPHPRADAVNAMRQSWWQETNYWSPPLPLLDRVVQKIRLEKAKGVLITPPWPRPWLPSVLELADTVLRLPVRVISPSTSFELRSGYLLAWRISGEDSFPTSLNNRENWWFRITSLRDWEKCSLL